ncbi:MAG: iron-containing alcohol dehydrogenase, partial [Prevotella sp.]|nr:iron-containing alcohol dehydrogenase [Prevotella sp.]
MTDFNYYAPTEVAFGIEAEAQLVPLINKYKRQGKVLVLFGGGSALRSGLIDRIEAKLADSAIESVRLGGVQPNPRLSFVKEGVELSRKEGVGMILAVGGGSVIDTAKAIGYGICYDGDVWDFYIGKAQVQDTMPVGCVLTIPAAGSEMSDCTVITNEATQQKLGYSSNVGRPKFAIMNPKLTYSLPDYQTACGAVDIMMHTMERYFTKQTDMLLHTSMAEALLRTVIKSADMLLCEKNISEEKTLQARAALMWASSLSHNDLMGGRTLSDFATHKIEHELSALYDVAHGAGLAAVWPSWAR